jgi:hypothetical protein
MAYLRLGSQIARKVRSGHGRCSLSQRAHAGTINPASGEHKPWRRDPLFRSMYHCGIVHRTHVERQKPRRARGRDVNIGAWSFVGLAAGSLVTVVLGVPWTTYIARRHTPPATWSTPMFRETNVVMTLCWACIFLAAAGVVAGTPLWVQPIVGIILYGLGRVSPCLAARYAARRARAMGRDLPR